MKVKIPGAVNLGAITPSTLPELAAAEKFTRHNARCTCGGNGMCRVCDDFVLAAQFYRDNPRLVTFTRMAEA